MVGVYALYIFTILGTVYDVFQAHNKATVVKDVIRIGSCIVKSNMLFMNGLL